MNLVRPESIGKTIEVQASNRPIKVAYLVPHEDTPANQMVLDGVFHESYTRWGGAYTLVIPTSSKQFIHSEYVGWLERYDPDFVYTYLELNPDLVETIDGLCSPIAFLKHNVGKEDLEDIRWRAFIPDWRLYFRGMSCVTTIPSPLVQPSHFMAKEPEAEVTVATQYPDGIKTRLFSDNFGTAFNTHNVTYPVHGLYKTLCLVPSDLPANHVAGTERCCSLADMLSAISTRKARPIARFAMAHSEAIWRVESYPWSDCFNLFIGNSLLDRLHFWNARHFTPSYAAYLGSIIVEPEFFQDPALVTLLGQYLNNNNFLGQGHGPAKVYLRSYSQDEAQLRSMADKLRKQTYNLVAVDKSFNFPAVPKKEDLERGFIGGLSDTSTFKLHEDSNTLIAKPPNHLNFLPSRFQALANGQWIIELDIQRHNNLSKFSNVVDTWELPRRRKIVQAFTNNLGKVSRSHRLAILPVTKDFPFVIPNVMNQDCSYNLALPDDRTFFRCLILDWFKFGRDDLRASVIIPSYQELQTSDKGQNLRGVISMFNSLYSAYQVLTNKYWRHVLQEGKVEHLVFTRNKLNSYLPNDLPTKEELRKKLRLSDIGKVSKYMDGNLTDALEYLIRLNVFFFVHQWRCEYCGHTNSCNFDAMKIKNACQICATEYLAPIDLDWKYQLNDFVYRSLIENTGLPVLWTLGFLQDVFFPRGSFWYLPEADLFEKYDVPETKKEIDILCMHGGKFIAAEVKRSAIQLINKPEAVDSFVQKMKLIRPDIAMLSFEQYCDSKEDMGTVRSSLKQLLDVIRSQIGSNIELKVIIAADTHGFNEAPVDLGYIGHRTDEIE